MVGLRDELTAVAREKPRKTPRDHLGTIASRDA